MPNNEPIELYVIVASSKDGDIVLSDKLSLSEATKKLSKIKRFRRSARIESIGYGLDNQITYFDELGEEALDLIVHELTEIEGGIGYAPSLEPNLNRLLAIVCLMGFEHIKSRHQTTNLGGNHA